MILRKLECYIKLYSTLNMCIFKLSSVSTGSITGPLRYINKRHRMKLLTTATTKIDTVLLYFILSMKKERYIIYIFDAIENGVNLNPTIVLSFGNMFDPSRRRL